MNVQEILEVVDRLIFKHTKESISDLQKAIILGTFDKKTYSEIGEDHYVSEDHVKRVGAELWDKLTAILGEKVKKKNLKWVIEKNKNFNNPIFIQNIEENNKVNLCRNTPNHQSNSSHNHQENNNKGNNPPQFKEDLTEILPLNSFYGRKVELNNFSNKILEQKSRLVSILGVSEIGKTAFTLQLIEQIKTNFNYVIAENELIRTKL